MSSIIVIILIIVVILRQKSKYKFKTKILNELEDCCNIENFENIYNKFEDNVNTECNGQDNSESKKFLSIFFSNNKVSFIYFTILAILAIILSVNIKREYSDLSFVIAFILSLGCIAFVFFIICRLLDRNKQRSDYRNEIMKEAIFSLYSDAIIKPNPKEKEQLVFFDFREKSKHSSNEYVRYETVDLTEVIIANSKAFGRIVAKIPKEKYKETFPIEIKKHVFSNNHCFDKSYSVKVLKNEDKLILTPDIKEKLVELYEKYNIIFYITIVAGNIYIEFHVGELFYNSNKNKKQWQVEYIALRNILKIIDEINKIF